MRPLLALVPLLALASTESRAEPALTSDDLFIGFGIGNFDQDLGRYTTLSPAWNVRIAFNPYPYVGSELNYQGIRSVVQNVPLPTGANPEGSLVLQSDFSFDIKGNAYLPTGQTGVFLPYLLGGAGFVTTTATSLFVNSGSTTNSTVVFPLGAGVEYVFTQGFALDGRFTYNILPGQRSTLVQSGNSWTAIISIGYRMYNR